MDLSKLSDAELLALAQQQQRAQPTGTLDAASRQAAEGVTFDSAIRQLAKGAPVVGSFMDEGAAALDAATHPVLGRGAPGETYSQRYQANVGRERAVDTAFEQANPKVSTGLQLGGGLAGGAGLVRGLPTVGNAIMGNVAGGMPSRMAAGGLAGLGLGAAHGFGEGTNLESRTAGAIHGGMVGAPLGMVAPAAADVVAAGANGFRNWLSNRAAAGALGVPPSAVRRVVGNVEADNLTPAGVQQRATELGPEGMVMDMGRQLRGRAEAVATLPGAGQNRVLEATEERVRTAADRIGRELDSTLGRSPNIVDLSNRIDSHFRQVLRPAYDNVMQAHPQVWNQTLETLTSRPSVQRAIDDAVTMAAEHGARIQSPFIRGADGGLTLQPGTAPNLAFWDYVKKSLDGRINAFARNPDLDSAGKTSMAALLDTKRTLVGTLDQITNGQYAAARNLAADKFTAHEALETGLGIFQNKMLPEQFAEEMRGMGDLQRALVAQGARRALERLRETSPANVSEGASAMYRELMQGGPHGDTSQKLRMLLGDNATDGLIDTARRETGFRSVYDQVASSSRTATRQALQADMQTPGTPDMTVTGIVNKVPMLPVQAAAGGILERGTQRTREGVADLLTRAGPERDRSMAALLDLANARAQRAAATPGQANTLAAALQSLAASRGSETDIPWLKEKSRGLARTLTK